MLNCICVWTPGPAAGWAGSDPGWVWPGRGSSGGRLHLHHPRWVTRRPAPLHPTHCYVNLSTPEHDSSASKIVMQLGRKVQAPRTWLHKWELSVHLLFRRKGRYRGQAEYDILLKERLSLECPYHTAVMTTWMHDMGVKHFSREGWQREHRGICRVYIYTWISTNFIPLVLPHFPIQHLTLPVKVLFEPSSIPLQGSAQQSRSCVVFPCLVPFTLLCPIHHWDLPLENLNNFL